MKQLTKEEAVALANHTKWEFINPELRAHLQLRQNRLCMPFSVFHESVEALMGRPVFTIEFADKELLLAEAGDVPDELKAHAKLMLGVEVD